jgi:hypothetical protein
MTETALIMHAPNVHTTSPLEVNPAAAYLPRTERLFAFGDDFWIENAPGDRVRLVDGEGLRIHHTLLSKQGEARHDVRE